mmetsp:Transcript_13393/g.45398  ORF Transcript_13393/g.45398 Transcript_13393/m.45398 type:complete len:333 (+) Transcript_13393:783-1781(+)
MEAALATVVRTSVRPPASVKLTSTFSGSASSFTMGMPLRPRGRASPSPARRSSWRRTHGSRMLASMLKPRFMVASGDTPFSVRCTSCAYRMAEKATLSSKQMVRSPDFVSTVNQVGTARSSESSLATSSRVRPFSKARRAFARSTSHKTTWPLVSRVRMRHLSASTAWAWMASSPSIWAMALPSSARGPASSPSPPAALDAARARVTIPSALPDSVDTVVALVRRSTVPVPPPGTGSARAGSASGDPPSTLDADRGRPTSSRTRDGWPALWSAGATRSSGQQRTSDSVVAVHSARPPAGTASLTMGGCPAHTRAERHVLRDVATTVPSRPPE